MKAKIFSKMSKLQMNVPVDKYLNHREHFDNDQFFEANPVSKDGRFMPLGKFSDENLRKVAEDIDARVGC
jgi:hypothetical protein